MKKLTAIILALAMLMSLAACGGSEEAASEKVSTEAPAPAAEAEEVKDCSHDWAEASCKTPRTCLLCGETEGEITEHSFGNWQAEGEEEMLRACTVCGEEERAELDREAIFQQLIVGNWDFHSSSGPYGDTNTYTQTPYMSRQLVIINEPDRATYWVSSIASGMDLIYDGYEKQEEGEVYNLHFEFDDGAQGSVGGYSNTMPAMLVCTEEGNFLSLIMEGMGYAMFSRNDEREQLIPGRYVCGEDYIELHPDRSITGDIGGEAKGYWTLKPVIGTPEGYIFGINVNVQRGSLPELDFSDPDNIDYSAYVNADYDVYISQDNFLIGRSIEELENFTHEKISISFVDTELVFLPEGVASGEPSDHDAAINNSGSPIIGNASLGDAYAGTQSISNLPSGKSGDSIVGKWQGDSLLKADGSTMRGVSSWAEFRADGSFSACFDSEVSGTWEEVPVATIESGALLTGILMTIGDAQEYAYISGDVLTVILGSSGNSYMLSKN